MTTIKEHIEAGHYERDEDCSGWSVPLQNNTTAKVFTAKCGGVAPLVGVVSVASYGWVPIKWYADGTPERNSSHWSCQFNLLPPPPRKAKVTRFHVLDKHNNTLSMSTSEQTAREETCRLPNAVRFVELTGEYEEPWDAR